jgi:2-isopropylmalate synthase
MQDIIFDWNSPNGIPFFTRSVELCDETLRDGIQSPSIIDPPIENKKHLLELMASLGVAMANIGLPGSGPRAFNDVLGLAKHVRDKRLRLKVNCAARTLKADIAPIIQIQQSVGMPIAAYCFLGSSPIRQYVEDWDIDRLIRSAEEAISFALANQLEVGFVTEDTTRSQPGTLEKLFRRVIDLGCRCLILCDTVGHATPDGVGRLVSFTKQLVQSTGADVAIEWHGHNDRGLAVINSIYAAYYGCDRVQGTCLGIGERVGNASLDQIIVNLKLLGGYVHDVSKLAEYVSVGSKALGVTIPKGYPVFGEDAFRTATGVHAAAVIKAERKGNQSLADNIYSGVPAGWFGLKQTIEIGPMSGLSNVRYWLERRRVELEPDLINTIFNAAKASNQVLSENAIWQIVETHRKKKDL